MKWLLWFSSFFWHKCSFSFGIASFVHHLIKVLSPNICRYPQRSENIKNPAWAALINEYICVFLHGSIRVFIAALSAGLTFSHLLFNLLCPAAYRRILSYKSSDNLDSGVSVVQQRQKEMSSSVNLSVRFGLLLPAWVVALFNPESFKQRGLDWPLLEYLKTPTWVWEHGFVLTRLHRSRFRVKRWWSCQESAEDFRWTCDWHGGWALDPSCICYKRKLWMNAGIKGHLLLKPLAFWGFDAFAVTKNRAA